MRIRRARVNENMRRVREELWQEALIAYGGRCECCGEDTPGFLTIEHPNGLPAEHRYGHGGRKNTVEVLRQLRNAGWPDTVKLYCFNCNCGRQRNGGVCPHVSGRIG